ASQGSTVDLSFLDSCLFRRREIGTRFGVLPRDYGHLYGHRCARHDFGLSAWWLALSSMLVWAAPAQVILISAFGGGAPLFEVAIAVCLSAIRLFPMVVALLPLLRGPGTRLRDLLFPTHFTYCVQYSSAYWSARSYCCLAAFYLPASHPAWMAAASILACSANTSGCSFSLTGGFIVTPALRGIT